MGTALLFLPVVIFAAGLLRFFVGQVPATVRRGELIPDLPSGIEPSTTIEGFAGSLELPQGTLSVRLVPLHRTPARQRGGGAALRERLGVEEGDPWRLALEFEATTEPGGGDEEGNHAPLELDASLFAVFDEDGVALTVAVPSESARERRDPLVALFALPTSLEASGTSVLLLGRRPMERPSLRIGIGGRLPAVALEATSFTSVEVARSFLQVGAAHGAVVDPRDEEIAQLRAALQAETLRRKGRELEWYEFNRALADLGLDRVPTFQVDEELIGAEELEPGAGAADPAEADPTEAELAEAEQREREEVVHSKLRALLIMAGLPSYDLLESGQLHGAGIGPVVFRLLDDRGRLAGTLAAESLCLEGSRAGRIVTLVLEDGYESRGGQRYPFENSVRRIALPYVDPGPWMSALPELFSTAALTAVRDDGLWNRETVRREINRLLSVDTSAGWYRIKGLGGIDGEEIFDVQLEAFDTDGRIDRRFFADKMRLFVEPPGVLIRLEGGVIERGRDRQAFLGGVHRIFLPRAGVEEWQTARLPGL